ncbi:hypothetical protein K505DRAFT_159899 [Melanomma pulvis-pyrius CBS 109.77]|uniref:Uncharacterized protein n=1 Tax=Melanomma pulvis-pyrius CBS 109.77 TaxID=1314802 RepID=A0A6A6WPL3_9PLEO|nr:hypothetical protein K505DRAFT_159899 [Melanomma pulvis-pyrius CBS 109.77]
MSPRWRRGVWRFVPCCDCDPRGLRVGSPFQHVVVSFSLLQREGSPPGNGNLAALLGMHAARAEQHCLQLQSSLSRADRDAHRNASHVEVAEKKTVGGSPPRRRHHHPRVDGGSTSATASTTGHGMPNPALRKRGQRRHGPGQKSRATPRGAILHGRPPREGDFGQTLTPIPPKAWASHRPTGHH